MASALLYLIYTYVIVIIQKGVFRKGQGKFSRIYYISFVIIACLLAVSTDFFYEISCDL